MSSVAGSAKCDWLVGSVLVLFSWFLNLKGVCGVIFVGIRKVLGTLVREGGCILTAGRTDYSWYSG